VKPRPKDCSPSSRSCSTPFSTFRASSSNSCDNNNSSSSSSSSSRRG
jgi:hypothetical protein